MTRRVELQSPARAEKGRIRWKASTVGERQRLEEELEAEGSWTNDAAPRVYAGRRCAALTACFAASGLAHEFFLWYMSGMKVAPSWEMTWFFLLQVPLMVVIRVPGDKNPRSCWTKKTVPTPIAVVVTLAIQLTLAHHLFFPPVVRIGLDQRMVD